MKPVYIYAENLDDKTKNQFYECVKKSYVKAAALMPDAHLGYAAPIGSVIATKGYVVPAWVGFDIGCGVCAFKLRGVKPSEIITNANKIYSEVSKRIPLGVGQRRKIEDVSTETISSFNLLVDKYRSLPNNKNLLNFFKTAALHQVGTLGGGNHFIELGSSGKEVWLVIHSGSRGIGHRIANHYMEYSAEKNKNHNIETTNAIKSDSEIGKEYMAAEEICLEYALLNRLEMGRHALNAIEKALKKKIDYVLWTNKNHNHVVLEKGLYIHRKGATPAKKKERGVIPGNMRDGSVLVEGKGNKKFLNSSSHGAGRIMSRKDAITKVSLDDFKSSMSGIKAEVSEATLNEAPQVYKNIEDVMSLQKSSVKVIKKIKPLINWKGIEDKFRD